VEQPSVRGVPERIVVFVDRPEPAPLMASDQEVGESSGGAGLSAFDR
jgi:hypothetical protein